jgi:ATP-dependent helicase HepA
MNQFIPGQRWISSNESELGLGVVLEVAFKRVTILFMASHEKRMYAIDNAPLTRVIFAVGDTIESVEDIKITVTRVHEQNGLVTYIGHNSDGIEVSLDEIELNANIQFNRPHDRLFTGQIDPNAWFLLRYQTWLHLHRLQQSDVKGLMGGRTSLIPHQLYIAHEVAKRTAPRVMLADEVGLGKTIEAGMIIHQRIVNNLSRRILIIVPESLLHQWLVEMLRRFNLRFSVFDEVRCLEESGDDGFDSEDDEFRMHRPNPFSNEQLILCSEQFFSENPHRQHQALDADWDIVIVDEAHHLEWNQHYASPEYLFIEQLSLLSPGLILLTATPEQLGKESHYARLRLLDPERFYSFAEFVKEEEAFEPVAQAAKLLLENQPIPEALQTRIETLVNDESILRLFNQLRIPSEAVNANNALLNILVDHHGTGRILFRNSRQTIQGFPVRHLHAYPLDGKAMPGNMTQDPYYLWLVNLLKGLNGIKVLLICKQANTAIILEQTLRQRAGILSAVFHEGMSIVERDRAAAFFADQESSARVLICSEIGSEGRNFQFVHHLILYDLPDNPDLLQQRIGRLDRIGQLHAIQIHVPYLIDSPQAVLYRWYHEGLNAFHSNSSAAMRVAEMLTQELDGVLSHPSEQEIDTLIKKAKVLDTNIELQLQNGRDLLLELNSCRPEVAEQLITSIHQLEKHDQIWPYLEDLFECYGIETEYHSVDCYIIRPGDHMRINHFPGVQEDGVTATVNRDMALAREDMQFFTWEHPTVSAAMDLVLSSETGNATIAIVNNDRLRPGQFLLECIFIAECSAAPELQTSRFMPVTPLRILIDQNCRDLSETLAFDGLIEKRSSFEKQQLITFINLQRQHLLKMLNMAQNKASQQLELLVKQANELMLGALSTEIKRLVRLRKVNPTIKQDEIDYLKDITLIMHEHIEATQLRLDAVRFLVTS